MRDSHLRAGIVLLVLLTTACSSEPEPLVPLEEVPTFAVMSSDFASSSFGFLDEAGDPLAEEWVDSGLTDARLSTAIHSDNAMPTMELGDGTFTIIDRFGADRITRFQFPSGVVLGQMRTQGPAATSGFSSNPQDVVYLSATEAFITRYEASDDPQADPINRGNDLLGFDPTTLALTGERIGLELFDTQVEVETMDGPMDVDAHARPVRVVKTADDLLAVGLDRLTDDFSGAAPGAIAIVDPSDGAVESHDLAPLRNCGFVTPVPLAGRQVAVRCLGYGAPDDADRGMVVLEIDATGDVTEVGAHRIADHPGDPDVVGNLLMLSSSLFIGVEHGAFDDEADPDSVYLVDLVAGTQTLLFETAAGFDVFGRMAFDPLTGLILVPSRSEGIHRLRYDATAEAVEYLDDFRFGPRALPVVSISRIN